MTIIKATKARQLTQAAKSNYDELNKLIEDASREGRDFVKWELPLASCEHPMHHREALTRAGYKVVVNTDRKGGVFVHTLTVAWG